MNRLPLAIASLLLVLPLVPVGHAAPATVTVTATSYSTGGVFHVEGTVTDPDGVHHMSVLVPGGSANAVISGSDFSADVTGIVQGPGTYTITLRTFDNNGVLTQNTTTVEVTGVYTVLYDREVVTSLGAYANYEEIILPHLYGGKINIDGLDPLSAVVVQQFNTGAAIPQCLGLGLLAESYECDFSVRPSSSPFEIVWVQALDKTVTVTISGYLL